MGNGRGTFVRGKGVPDPRNLRLYEYQVTQYNPETGEGGHFVDYINTFLKLKAEASGNPGWVRSPPDEELNIETFWKNEGIRFDRESIKSNAAKRGLAKFCLNSMWVKLTERNDRTQTKVISEQKDLYNFLATPDIKVTNLAFASDDVLWILWKHAAEEHVPNLRHTNGVIGAYVTAGARIHLSLSRPVGRESDLLRYRFCHLYSAQSRTESN